MTGGGFGGCVIAVTTDSKADLVVRAIADNYRTPEGLQSDVFICQPSAGASRI